MEGLNRGIYEIFEIILAVSLLLVISTAIFLTYNPSFISGNVIYEETLIMSNLIQTNSNITLNLNKDNIKKNFDISKNQNNQIEISFDGNTIKKEEKFPNIKIEKDKNNPKIITITKIN